MPNVAIAASVNANAAAANAEAARAERIACMKYVQGYEHDKATIVEMRQYAECVERLHPEPMTGSEVLWVKAAIIAGLLAAVLGAAKGFKDDGFGMGAIGFVLGGFCGAFLVVAVWFVIACLRYLLA